MPYGLSLKIKTFILNKISKHLEILGGIQGIITGIAFIFSETFVSLNLNKSIAYTFYWSIILSVFQIISILFKSLYMRHWTNLFGIFTSIICAYLIYINFPCNLIGIGAYVGMAMFNIYSSFITQAVRHYNKNNLKEIKDDDGQGVFRVN